MHASSLGFVSHVLSANEVINKDIYAIAPPEYRSSLQHLLQKGTKTYSEFGKKGEGAKFDMPIEFMPREMETHVIVSLEELHHAEDWANHFQALALLTAEILIVTTRSPGSESEGPTDRHRLSCSDLFRAAISCGMSVELLVPDPTPGSHGAFMKAIYPGFSQTLLAPPHSPPPETIIQ